MRNRKTRYTPKIAVRWKDSSWIVPHTWEWHLQRYLKSPESSFDGLHKAMRKHGTDWFTVSNSHKPHPAEWNQNISEGMRSNHIWNRGLKTGIYHSKTPPHVKEWGIVTNNGLHITTNLVKFCKENNISLNAVKARLRRNSWPYLNILEIKRWS